jgi:Restriction endonuclease
MFALAVIVFAVAWPWMLGTYLAVKCGAENPSAARSVTGWVFEAVYLVCLALIGLGLISKRSEAKERASAHAAEQQLIAAQAREEAAARAAEQQRIAAQARDEAAARAAEQQRIAAQARDEAAARAAASAKVWQRERWTDDVALAGDDLARVLAIDGIVPQVDAENARIEAHVRSLQNIFLDALPVPSNMALDRDLTNNSDGITKYISSVLASMPLPDGCVSRAEIAYSADSRQLVVEYELPSIRFVPAVKWYRYIDSRKRLAATARPVSQVKSLYGGALAQLVLLCIAYIFGSDTKRDVDVVVVNGVVDTVDPRSGKPVRPCLITVRVTRDIFSDIDLTHIEPFACLKHLSASVSRSPSELVPVRPLVEFSMVDPRFITETDTLTGMDARPNLMELSPNQFESLIQNLFTSMGLEARQTRASRDGGVDCVAYDTRPIFGGKVVIQAKRYKHTVGVSAVRDLYGTLQNEGASKGILVTTSGYGKASFEFAQNKPIELIDGGNLLYLLEEHAGMKARIEAPEDWLDPMPDSAQQAT